MNVPEDMKFREDSVGLADVMVDPVCRRPFDLQIGTGFLKTALCGHLSAARGTGSGRGRIGREVPVDLGGALASLADRPHDQRLAAAGVAGGEHAFTDVA